MNCSSIQVLSLSVLKYLTLAFIRNVRIFFFFFFCSINSEDQIPSVRYIAEYLSQNFIHGKNNVQFFFRIIARRHNQKNYFCERQIFGTATWQCIFLLKTNFSYIYLLRIKIYSELAVTIISLISLTNPLSNYKQE